MSVTTEEMYGKVKPSGGKKKIAVSAAVILFVAASAFIWFRFIKSGDNIQKYITARPFAGNVVSKVSASGTIAATNEVEVGSQVSGTILEVTVEENDSVKKGQVLAIIDPATIKQTIQRNEAQLNSARAALNSAAATLENKKWNYERLKGLYDDTGGKAPSETGLLEAEMEYKTAVADTEVKKAAVKEAETTLNSSRIDLNNSIITSPVDGVVLKRSVDAGQTVAAAYETPELFVVAENLEKMKLVVNVSEADVGKVREGQKAVFTVDAYPDNEFSSVVARVNVGSTTSDNNVVSYETTIYVDNPDLLLRSGMSATADIETAKAENVLLVPVAALFFDPQKYAAASVPKKGGGMFGPPHNIGPDAAPDDVAVKAGEGAVYILQNDIPVKKNVKAGVSDGRYVQITADDINEDTEVITGLATPL